MSNTQLEKTHYLSQLFDHYKELLTEKQRNYFELYFLEDWTMQEIADDFSISRAAVLDSLNKTVEILNNYEKVLKNYETFLNIKNAISDFRENKISLDDLLKMVEGEINK